MSANSDQAQALSLAHDQLHKGEVEEAHRIIHRGLGIEDGVIDQSKAFFRDFDVAFNTACRKNNVLAAYVIFDLHDPGNPRKARILTGGEMQTVSLLKMILAAGQHAIASPVVEDDKRP